MPPAHFSLPPAPLLHPPPPHAGVIATPFCRLPLAPLAASSDVALASVMKAFGIPTHWHATAAL